MEIGNMGGGSPLLILTLLAIGIAIFVNGWTDAPMAITSCVASGALRFRHAAILAAVGNLVGLAVSARFFPAVAAAVPELISLPEGSGAPSLGVLACALATTALWAVVAWIFGLPTSESHALLAGLGGAAVALTGKGALPLWPWLRVGIGLLFSLFGGAFGGFLTGIAVKRIWKTAHLHERSLGARWLLTVGAATMSFMHGAQDGQKFIGIWLLACDLGGVAHMPLTGVALICALFMGVGTLMGGGRIVRTLGEKLVRTGLREGVAADLGGAVCLLFLTLWGIPVSTTHTKTAAVVGTGVAMGRGRVDTGTVGRLLMAWLLTFPVCFLLSFGAMKGLLALA